MVASPEQVAFKELSTFFCESRLMEITECFVYDGAVKSNEQPGDAVENQDAEAGNPVTEVSWRIKACIAAFSLLAGPVLHPYVPKPNAHPVDLLNDRKPATARVDPTQAP